MNQPIVGRKAELAVLQEAVASQKPEMVAVIGRRRVGKTYLILNTYQGKIDFEISGTQHAPTTEQLQNFSFQLAEAMNLSIPVKQPKNWMEAFYMLIQFLKEKRKKDDSKKQIVFFDEVPWLATSRSGFLRALAYFWNSWASREHIVVVICGSAASWMIQKIVNNRGGLHNRITQRIHLQPFTLAETEAYLKSKHIHFEYYQILQIYMAFGGIPHYLEEIKAGYSATQNIERICFSPTGLLRDEFFRLYPALFAKSENHITVIRALASKRQGLTRKEILELTELNDGGSITKVLQELVHSGFISIYPNYGKRKTVKIYRLTDEYSLFFLKFMENKLVEGEDTWQHLSQTQSYKSWIGYAFENVCLKHIKQIKKALEIGGIYTISSSFHKKGTTTKQGTQIDLIIDRNDQIINICEIKFYNEEFSISKNYAANLRDKMRIFREHTKTKKQLSVVFITTFGLKQNSHSLALNANSIIMNDLFIN